MCIGGNAYMAAFMGELHKIEKNIIAGIKSAIALTDAINEEFRTKVFLFYLKRQYCQFSERLC